MIVDAHVHMGPGLGNHADACLFDAYTGDQLIAAMDKAGIDAGLFLLHYGRAAIFTIRAMKRETKLFSRRPKNILPGLLATAASIQTLERRPCANSKRCISDYRFKGIMMHPEWESFAANDLNLLGPIFRIARQYKLPVTFHTGYYPTCQPLLFLPLAEAFPDVTIMLKHMGYEYLRDAIVVARLTNNVLLETAGNTSAAEIRAGIKGAGAEKVVFGSDLPYVSPEIVIQRIQLMEDVSEQEKRAVLGEQHRPAPQPSLIQVRK